ncbi:MAG TPA: SRPBCC domain-containing protein [Candidatus Saccharimonadales bacterium]|nr:SRPBCC domain-containing protein [Candidatus Saccharimonadales bacterium]
MNDIYTLTAEVVTDASPQEIWDAWNNPEKVAKWWGPAGFTSTVDELNVQAGGKMRITMHGPDGVDYPNIYTFDEIHPLSQLIYTNEGSEQFDLAPFQSVVDIQENAGKTKLSLKMRFVSQEEKDKHVNQFHADEGSRQLLERLGEQAKA